jgi:hypothetical protein
MMYVTLLRTIVVRFSKQFYFVFDIGVITQELTPNGTEIFGKKFQRTEENRNGD